MYPNPPNIVIYKFNDIDLPMLKEIDKKSSKKYLHNLFMLYYSINVILSTIKNP